ncbi:MAG TPA: DUF664 domain-containing protein [Candidatus Lustribacter sp.]|nr:DUF664 domain-containing protein [Candidatus Lustribacter sp.]
MSVNRPLDLLADAFGRVQECVADVVAGLSAEDLAYQPDPAANSIGWLIWHLARVEDDHIAGIAGSEQVWARDGWAGRFALPYPVTTIGYGHSAADVAAFRVVGPGLLAGYYDAVHARTLEVLRGLPDAGFDRIVDERWDPPVTAAVRLVSVVNDVTQHAGQAAYVRGLLERRRS